MPISKHFAATAIDAVILLGAASTAERRGAYALVRVAAFWLAATLLSGCVSGNLWFTVKDGPDGRPTPEIGGTLVFGSDGPLHATKPEADE